MLGPAFAIDRMPAPVCFSSCVWRRFVRVGHVASVSACWRQLRRTRVISSSNFSPYMLSPPRPVPVGSPPCENSEQTRSGQKTQPHAGCWRHKLTAWARLNHEVFDYAVEAGSGGAEARQRNENAESRADVRE